jgi:hypothetical protein
VLRGGIFTSKLPARILGITGNLNPVGKIPSKNLEDALAGLTTRKSRYSLAAFGLPSMAILSADVSVGF